MNLEFHKALFFAALGAFLSAVSLIAVFTALKNGRVRELGGPDMMNYKFIDRSTKPYLFFLTILGHIFMGVVGCAVAAFGISQF